MRRMSWGICCSTMMFVQERMILSDKRMILRLRSFCRGFHSSLSAPKSSVGIDSLR